MLSFCFQDVIIIFGLFAIMVRSSIVTGFGLFCARRMLINGAIFSLGISDRGECQPLAFRKLVLHR